MIDTTNHQSLSFSTDGDAGPYLMVPVVQLDKVRKLLETNKVPHWVDEEAISLDGKPEVVVINLGRGSNPALVQHLLDSIPLRPRTHALALADDIQALRTRTAQGQTLPD